MNWINANKDWFFSGIGVTIIVALATFFRKILIKNISNLRNLFCFYRKNIFITLSDRNCENPFSLSSISVNSVDIMHQRIIEGATIIIRCKEYKVIKKMIKSLGTNANASEFYRYKSDLNKKLENIAKTIECGITNETISRSIFSVNSYIDGVISLEFFYLRKSAKRISNNLNQETNHATNNTVKMDIYNELREISFSVDISHEKYEQILKLTDERVKLYNFVSCNEVFDASKDAYIYDHDILPAYSRFLLCSKTNDTTQDVRSMNISVG